MLVVEVSSKECLLLIFWTFPWKCAFFITCKLVSCECCSIARLWQSLCIFCSSYNTAPKRRSACNLWTSRWMDCVCMCAHNKKCVLKRQFYLFVFMFLWHTNIKPFCYKKTRHKMYSVSWTQSIWHGCNQSEYCVDALCAINMDINTYLKRSKNAFLTTEACK